MSFLSNHPVATAALVIVAVWFARLVIQTVKYRKLIKKLPGPPHNPIFGHLISVGKVTTTLPKRVHPHVLPYYLTKEYDLPPVFYMDVWPANQPMLIILDPDTAQEVNANSGLHKHPSIAYIIGALAGKVNLLTMEGALWKKWRAVFNPGFSTQHLVSQVPTIVDCTEYFVKILDQHASKGKVFRLEEEATKITIDIIGKVSCDHDFKSLTSNNEFLELMRKILSWMPDSQSLDPLHRNHPLRPLFWKYYKWQMDKYIGRILDERFSTRGTSLPKKARKKTGIDLALEAYFKESGQDVDSRTATMDAEFRQYAIDNLLLLLFAGHDTTASTICYCYHMLAKHPAELAKMRTELDEVFGPGVHGAEQLRQDPYMINKCEYTLAVIREVLRLWPPASGVRIGRKGYFIKDPATGNMLPTEGFLVWPVTIAMQRDARIWGEDAFTFRPERFLSENADKINPNSFRPFERGPRNCIGQELALIEMKVVLALTIREFDVTSAYDELDSLKEDGSMWAAEKSQKIGPQECFGDEAYQILLAAGKPREGMPARVRRTTKD